MNNRQLVQQIKARSARIAREEREPGGKRERDMIALWRQIRPQMVARLEGLGVLEEFAHLLAWNRSEAESRYLDSGLGWPDSREEANRDWLISEPESQEEDDQAEQEALRALLASVARDRA